MKQKSLAYAKYRRICLADADLGKGALYRSDLEKLMLRPANELQNGRVDAELTQELFKHASQDVRSKRGRGRYFSQTDKNIDHGPFYCATATPDCSRLFRFSASAR